MIMFLKPLLHFFLAMRFNHIVDFRPRDSVGKKKVKALSVAGEFAGMELRSMAASYSITWPQHYVHKWISDWSAQQHR